VLSAQTRVAAYRLLSSPRLEACGGGGIEVRADDCEWIGEQFGLSITGERAATVNWIRSENEDSACEDGDCESEDGFARTRESRETRLLLYGPMISPHALVYWLNGRNEPTERTSTGDHERHQACAGPGKLLEGVLIIGERSPDGDELWLVTLVVGVDYARTHQVGRAMSIPLEFPESALLR